MCAYGEKSCVVCDDKCNEVAGKTSYCGDSVTDKKNGEKCDGDSPDCKTVDDSFANGGAPCKADCSGYNTENCTSPGDMITLPDETFTMGCSSGSCATDTLPLHEVFISEFEMDLYEVTVKEYEACVDAGKCSAPGIGYNCNYAEPAKYKNHPVNCVLYSQAEEYCEWVGKRLPTEAEWERSARNSDTPYPWGITTPSCDFASMDADNTSGTPDDGGCGTGRTQPVGSYPAGRSLTGLYDMAGNVYEFCSDFYADNFYASSERMNPENKTMASDVVIRGGDFTSLEHRLEVSP